MTFGSFITTVGSVAVAMASIYGVAVAAAALNDDGRARLTRWTTRFASVAFRLADFIYALVSLGNGIVGIAIFYVQTTPPTRHEIVHLLLFLTNIAIGCWRFAVMANRAEAQRNAAKAS